MNKHLNLSNSISCSMKKFIGLIILLTLSTPNIILSQTISKIKITRYLTAKSGFQVIEFENNTVTNWVSNRKPLRIELFKSKVKLIENEINLIDLDKLNEEIEALLPINQNSFPKVYYQIIINKDTIQTKEFLLATLPNSLKRLDQLLFNYSIGM